MLCMRETTMHVLKHNLEKAQQRMKMLANRQTYHTFQIGEWVYVKLQPYRQVSMHQGIKIFQPKYFGPFQVIKIIGKVAYRLQLPNDILLHNVFHVSLLKPANVRVQASPWLPFHFQSLQRWPHLVIDKRLVKSGDALAVKLLIQ